jgi:hypothetical protein
VTAVLLTFRRVKNNSEIDTADNESGTNIFITGGARRLAVRVAQRFSATRVGGPAAFGTPWAFAAQGGGGRGEFRRIGFTWLRA